MAKYIILSDSHFSRHSFTAEIQVMLDAIARAFGKNSVIFQKMAGHWNRKESKHIRSFFDKAAARGPFDGLISLGDNFYDWDGLGLDTAEKISDAKEFKNGLIRRFGVENKNQIWVPGNHDLGYKTSLGSAGPSLPTAENYQKFKNIFGPTHGIRQLDENNFLAWLSTAHVETILNKEQDSSWIREKQKEELDFLEDGLGRINGKFFFCVHDPLTFLAPGVAGILDKYHRKLSASFTGHLHADWLLKLAKIKRPGLSRAFSRYKIQFIPSLWGIILPLLFWTTGAGWAELCLGEDGARMEKHAFGIKTIKKFRF